MTLKRVRLWDIGHDAYLRGDDSARTDEHGIYWLWQRE
jgi:hypothetical protein